MIKTSDVVVLADADNTLWDTDARFAFAQLRLLEVVESLTGLLCNASDRLRFVRSFDQALAREHHLHFRYPARMLVDALKMGLAGAEPETAAKALIHRYDASSALADSERDKALTIYANALDSVPELLSGVLEGLQLAKARGVLVYVLTEGKADLQRSIVAHHHLSELISGVSEATKSEVQFARYRRRYADSDVVVIGDQPSRDIVPAHAAGCVTVLVPSRFQPVWDIFKECPDADYVAENFLLAVQWVVANRVNRIT